MTTVSDIYQALAVRINYPVTPTYRCLQKIIGHINLIVSLANTPQVIVEVPLSGEPNKRFYNRIGERIAYLKSGKPCQLNPDGTIHTKEESGYVIRTGLFQDPDTGNPKIFVTSEKDVLADDYYLQPMLTAVYLLLNGVQPNEAALYLIDACTKTQSEVETSQVNLDNIKRRI